MPLDPGQVRRPGWGRYGHRPVASQAVTTLPNPPGQPAPSASRPAVLGPYAPAVVARLGLALLAVFTGVAVLALLTRATGGNEPVAFDRTFVASCGRSGADDAACRCALDRWHEAVPEAQRMSLDEDLAAGQTLPDDVAEAVATCR